MSKRPLTQFRLARTLLLLVALLGTSAASTAEVDATEMKHYKNEQWRFELDVPKRWTVLPGGAQGASNQLVRFMSVENGNHLLGVSRHMLTPLQTPAMIRDQNQEGLARKGATNFVQGETVIGTHRALTLDFETTAPDGTSWYTRHYYIIQGPIGYQLSFGTSDRRAMFDLYERMAKSFVFEAI